MSTTWQQESELRRVCIIQRTLPHYRVALFQGLYEKLLEVGIELTVIYGQNAEKEVPVTVHTESTWAKSRPNLYLSGNQKGLVWQGCLSDLRGYDLIVIEYAGRLLLNYVLLALRSLRFFKLAFWGHGRNFQAERVDSVKEKVKRHLLGQVDWWFAYTALSKATILAANFSEAKITVLNNTIDDTVLRAQFEKVRRKALPSVHVPILDSAENIALYCGGIYEEKKIPFLIDACIAIRERLPDFQFFWIGSGPDEYLVRNASANFEWMHYVGPLFNEEKLRYFARAKLHLMPGLVGLTIIDSFITEVPIVTTRDAKHSPEIAYLVSDENGVIAGNELQDFVDKVVFYMSDNMALERLRQGCREASRNLTLENMIGNFAHGIEKALEQQTPMRKQS